MKEPAIHSQILNALPDAHPLAYEDVSCEKCGDPIHTAKNACVSLWVETGRGCYCMQCFVYLAIHENMILNENWSLPDSGEINVVIEPQADSLVEFGDNDEER